MIAAVLAILNLILPPDRLMFQLGERNMPWVPTVVFASVGIVFFGIALWLFKFDA